MTEPKKVPPESASLEARAPEGDAIKAEFSRRWWLQVKVSAPVFVLMVPLVILGDSPLGPPGWLVFCAGAAVLVAAVTALKNWRCPVCSRYLGKRTFGIHFCSGCGAELA